MTDALFNGPELVVKFPSTGKFSASENLYSAWKEWVKLADNAKFPQAFETTGGDPVGSGQTIGAYFFCRNDFGWRIEMPDADGEVILTGNLFARDDSLPLLKQALGYDAFFRLEVSTQAIVVQSGGSGLTPEQEAKLNLIPALLA